MTQPRTLRNRLALVALVSTGAWVLVLTALFNVLLGVQLGRQADGVLRARAAAVAVTVHVDDSGAVTVREPANDEALDAGVWVFDGGTAVERPRASTAATALAREMATAGGPRFREVGSGPAVRLYVRAVRQTGEQVGAIVVETSLAPYRRTSRVALVGSVLLALFVLAGAFAATRQVVRRALVPVSEMAEQAALWSAHDVGQRFGDAPRPEELRDLAGSLDVVLDRIGAVLRHEQQLAAEISHELRTPLAVIATEAELLLTSPRDEVERRRGHEAIAATATRMASLLDDLLAQAAQVVTEAPGRCAVRPVADEVLAALEAPGLVRVVDVPAALEAGVTTDVLARILTALVGNASRYARTRITVAGTRAGAGVQVRVSDDGPGVPADFRPDVFEPGRRADPDDGHAGAGLGLALARRLARAAGGDITLDGGTGSEFVVVLPPA
ncbi:MAG: HAMP domain-containing sensor histidine kinase [Sporichthyaceae bacterium]